MTTRDDAAPVRADDGRSAMDKIKLGVSLAGLALLLIFFLQNRQEVDVNLLWFEWQTGLVWALLAAAVLGALSAVALSTIRGRARRRAEG